MSRRGGSRSRQHRLTRPSRLAPGRIAALLAAIAVLAAMLLVPVASASAADGRRGVRCDECAKDDGCDEEYGSPRAEFEHRAPY